MRYILDLDLVKGYEEMAVKMYDETTKRLHAMGIIKINKQDKIGKPVVEERLELLGKEE